uniref:Uncharacterized protein n=1 Tax=Oryza barthii TaxID=65489 RepID=A0A0D3G5R7_9ORYZ
MVFQNYEARGGRAEDDSWGGGSGDGNGGDGGVSDGNSGGGVRGSDSESGIEGDAYIVWWPRRLVSVNLASASALFMGLGIRRVLQWMESDS